MRVVSSLVHFKKPLLVLAFAICATPALSDTSSGAKSILMVVRSKSSQEAAAGDKAIADHLRAAGFIVDMRDTNAGDLTSPNADLIAISSSVSGKELSSQFRDSQIPVVAWEPAVLPYMGMSGKNKVVDYGEDDEERSVWLVNAPHPIAAGLQAGHHNFFSKNVEMGWAKPGLGASIIATLPGEPTKAAVFSYERGATMDYENIAPARRVFLFLNSVDFSALSADGLRVFDASIRWALDEPLRTQ